MTDKKEDIGLFVSWSDMVVPEGIISLPVKAEEWAEILKAEFLNWHHELGQTKVDGRSLIFLS